MTMRGKTHHSLVFANLTVTLAWFVLFVGPNGIRAGSGPSSASAKPDNPRPEEIERALSQVKTVLEQLDKIREEVRRIETSLTQEGEKLHQANSNAEKCPSCALVGQKLESMTLHAPDARLWEFNKHRRGKLVLLSFWSSKCGPCLRAIPHLCELKNQFGANSDLQVLGIAYEPGSFSQQAEQVRDARVRLGMNYPSLLGGGGQGPCPVKTAFDVHFFPTLILIDQNNAIVWRSGQEGLTEEKLRELKQEIGKRIVGSTPPQVEEAKEKKVAALLKQFEQSYKEGKYAEAESSARKALELDPRNATIATAITIATTKQKSRERPIAPAIPGRSYPVIAPGSSPPPSDDHRRIEELERRIQELERRLREGTKP